MAGDEGLAEEIARLGAADEAARVAASDALAKRVERGEAVGAALEALGRALSDENATVRGNAAWVFATLGQQGVDLGPVMAALAGALASPQLNVARNVAWAVGQTAARADVTAALPELVAQLGRDDTFANARVALANAIADGPAREAARRAVEEAFGRDGDGATRTRAALILARDALARGDVGAVEARIRHADWHARFGVAKALGEVAATSALPAAAVGPLASLLSDAEAAVRQAAATALVDAVEHGTDVTAALPALGGALRDPELAVRKEAIWAAAMAARRGTPLGPARAPLEACAADEATRGNASLGLFFDDLRDGKRAAVEAQLGAAHGHTQFAAAYALTEEAARTQDRALFESLLGRIRVGIADLSISQGIAGALADRQRRGDDAGWALGVIQALIAATTDPLVHTPLMGVLMNLQRATGGG